MVNVQVLVVEDEVSIAGNIVEILQLHGMDAVWQANGKSAIESLNKQRFDLVLCDINLPDVDGFTILHELRNNPAAFDTPFIFLTAFAGQEDVREGMNKGADDYITKPFTVKTLMNAVQARLEKSRRDAQFLKSKVAEKWFEILSVNFNQEFITPLHGILSANQVLELSLPGEQQAELQETIRAIYVSGKRMLRNTRRLLHFSMISSRANDIHERIQRGNCNIETIVDEVVKDYAAERATRDTAMPVLQVAPVGVQPVNGFFFRIIAEELFGNMLRFNEGALPPTVCLTKTEYGFVLQFTNNTLRPVNFTLADIKAFTKFHEDLSLNGLGIGLYLVKTLCSMMNLSLKMESRENEVCFSVCCHPAW